MKVKAKRSILYGRLYAEGEIIELEDIAQARIWADNDAVDLMGFELPSKTGAQDAPEPEPQEAAPEQPAPAQPFVAPNPAQPRNARARR